MEALLPRLHGASGVRGCLHCHGSAARGDQPGLQEDTVPQAALLQGCERPLCQAARVGGVPEPDPEVGPHLDAHQHALLHGGAEADAPPCRREHQLGGVPRWPARPGAAPEAAQVCGHDGDGAWAAGPAGVLGGVGRQAAPREGQDIPAGALLALDGLAARRRGLRA